MGCDLRHERVETRRRGAAAAPATRGAGNAAALDPVLPPIRRRSGARENPGGDRTWVPTGDVQGSMGCAGSRWPLGDAATADRCFSLTHAAALAVTRAREAQPLPLTRPWSSRDSAAWTSSRDRS